MPKIDVDEVVGNQRDQERTQPGVGRSAKVTIAPLEILRVLGRVCRTTSTREWIEGKVSQLAQAPHLSLAVLEVITRFSSTISRERLRPNQPLI